MHRVSCKALVWRATEPGGGAATLWEVRDSATINEGVVHVCYVSYPYPSIWLRWDDALGDREEQEGGHWGGERMIREEHAGRGGGGGGRPPGGGGGGGVRCGGEKSRRRGREEQEGEEDSFSVWRMGETQKVEVWLHQGS